jgi:hypothetical protein
MKVFKLNINIYENEKMKIIFFLFIIKMAQSNYDIYKYVSEFASSTVSMSVIDYILYNKNMN